MLMSNSPAQRLQESNARAGKTPETPPASIKGSRIHTSDNPQTDDEETRKQQEDYQQANAQVEELKLQIDPRFHLRHANFFTPGRLFKVWEPGYGEIHEKLFLLLDTKNKEGPCLPIRIYTPEEISEENNGFFHRAHVLVQEHVMKHNTPPQNAHPKRKVAFMDDYMQGAIMQENSFIQLDHIHTVSYDRPCDNFGMLSRQSLKRVRTWYIEWLRYHWEDEVSPAY